MAGTFAKAITWSESEGSWVLTSDPGDNKHAVRQLPFRGSTEA
ncbi:hypothetical protein ACIODT_36840 [Streptomyces sp. NPDC088251]